MKRKHLKTLALIALGVVVLGAAGSLARGGTSSPAHGTGDTSIAVEPDPVLQSIGKALGQDIGGFSEQAAPTTGRNATTANSAAGGAPAALPPAAADSATSSKAAVPGGTTAQAPSSSVDTQKVVQTASISMQAKNVDGVTDQIGLVAASLGGVVAASKSSTNGDQTFATITIKVPSDKFQEALSQVRALGARIDSQSSNATEVTAEYTDLESQVRNLRATEAQLLTFLGQAKNISEVLQVQDRLNAVRGDIERTQGRLNLLDKLSDMGTISAQLRPLVIVAKADSGGGSFSTAVSEAWQHSLDLIGGVATGVVTVLVFSWWLVLLGVPALLVWQRWLRSRPTSSPASAAVYD